MKKLIVLVFASMLLMGCTKTIIKYKYIDVNIPIQVPVTPPPTIVKPILPVNLLTVKDKKDYPKVAKAYITTIRRLKAYSEKQEKALDVYRPKKNND